MGGGGGGGGAGGAAEEVKLNAPPPLVSEWPRLPKRTPDGPYKLYVGGFDPLHTEWQVRQLLQAVGPLQSFAVMPAESGKITGHAFCEYKAGLYKCGIHLTHNLKAPGFNPCA